MVKPPSFDSNGMKKGAWSEDEDNKLRTYIQRYGHWNWRLLPNYAGLKRCGKSCRLRWVNYLKPGVKKGNFTKEEQDLIIKLHVELGNKWSAIASKLPGRTDNEIKNFWHTRVEKRRRKQYPAAKKPKSSTDQASSSMTDATSLTTSSQHLSSTPPALPSHDHADEDQLDSLLSDILAPDTTANYDSFFEEEFNYFPEFRHTELSSSGSSYTNNWAVEVDDSLIHRSFWNESSASNSSECESSEEERLLYYDPLLEYFDYDMTRFCFQP